MSKNYYKNEEVPPLKKSLIQKIEKQYGKDNPKTYATLWKIYKDTKKEDAPANATGSAVAGTGDDVADWGTSKKKKKKKYNKYSPNSLGRQFKIENAETLKSVYDVIRRAESIIDDSVANVIQAQLLFLQSTDSSRDIQMYICKFKTLIQMHLIFLHTLCLVTHWNLWLL